MGKLMAALLCSFMALCCLIFFGGISENSFWLCLSMLLAFFVGAAYRLGWFILDEGNLFKQPLFIMSVALPFLFFIMFGLWSWRGFNVDLSYKGYNVFLDLSRFPLLILALSVPLAAMINNIHRTIQTEKQIRETEKKNSHDYYYSHVKFHVEQFTSIEGVEINISFPLPINKNSERNIEVKHKIKIQRPLGLYRIVFPNSSIGNGGNYDVSIDFLKKIAEEWSLINDLAAKISNRINAVDEHKNDFYGYLMDLYSQINVVHDRLCIFLCLSGYHSQYSFCINAKSSSRQCFSTFFNVLHMYKSLTYLDVVTRQILDKVYGDAVSDYFDLNENLFHMGSGFVENWYMYFDFIALMDYQQPQCHRGPGHFINGA